MTTEITIPEGKRTVVENWCVKKISPRLYWIHNRRGGEGWAIHGYNKEKGYTIKIEDEKKALLMILECL